MKEQTEVGKLKEGRYVVVDDEPCRIVSIAISKPGKHGAAKSRIDCIGVFDGVKRSIVQPVSAKIYVPVELKIAQVIRSPARPSVRTSRTEMFELNVTAEEAAGLELGKEVAY